VTGYTCTDIE